MSNVISNIIPSKVDLTYFVALSILPKRIESYFRCQDILAVQRDDETQLETVVVVLTPKGAQPFKVAESPSEVALAVDRWYKSQLPK